MAHSQEGTVRYMTSDRPISSALKDLYLYYENDPVKGKEKVRQR